MKSIIKNPTIIKIKNQNFYYMKTRNKNRGPHFLYRGENSFLKWGTSEYILKEYRCHKNLERLGFIVPELLSNGKFLNKDFYIERSLGNETFSENFSKDFKKNGVISNKIFKEFLEKMTLYTKIQIATIKKQPYLLDDIFEHIDMDLLEEYVSHKNFDAKKTLTRIQKNLKIFPAVLSHGDLSSDNMLPDGIIDFEHVCNMPIGYDQISILYQTMFLPTYNKDYYEQKRFYYFSKKQREIYIRTIDQLFVSKGLPSLSLHINNFIMLRLIWLTEHTTGQPLLRRWRQKKLIEYITL